MEVECPKCGKENDEIEGEDLPLLACDKTEYECEHCGHEFMIGWIAEVEVRDTMLSD